MYASENEYVKNGALAGNFFVAFVIAKPGLQFKLMNDMIMTSSSLSILNFEFLSLGDKVGD